MSNTITLMEDGETIMLQNIQIRDHNLYDFLTQAGEEDRGELVVAAIRIGAVGLRRMVSAEELDYVQKEFDSLLQKFNKMFDPNIKTSHFGHLSALLETYFAQGGNVEKLFDPSVDDSPLGKLRKTMLDELLEVKNAILKKEITGELVDITALKGGEFEDACESVLSVFVSQQIGDELERTTSMLGKITASFAGDFVISLRDSQDKRIVLETKDRWNMTQPKILESLENALENRNAQYGVYVSKYKEQLPKKIGWFNEFRGNMLVCALGSQDSDTFWPEALNIAYQWAKLRVAKEMTIEEKALQTIFEGIKEMERTLATCSKIRTECTNLETATESIRELLNDLQMQIDDQLTQIKKAIAAVSKEENE